jgi:hypothetical protein
MVWQLRETIAITNRGRMLQASAPTFRLTCLIAVTAILLSACGGGTDASTATVRGPALLFFYTDN